MLQPGIQRWLQHHCDSSDAVSGGVVVLAAAASGAPGASDMVAEWPASGHFTPSLAAAAQAAVQRARPVVVAPTVRTADADHNRVISLPLKSGDRMLGAVALAVRAADTQAVERLFAELAQASAAMGASLGRDAAAPQPSPVAQVLALQALLLEPPTLAEGATALATELAAVCGAERVSVGALDHGMAVVALSHSAEFTGEQSLLQMAAAAMQEAADQGARVVYPAPATEPPRIVLAHAALQARTGLSVLTLPLVHAGRAVGALMVEWRGEAPPNAEQTALCEGVAAAIGAPLSLRQQAERPWRTRLARTVGALWRRLARRDDPWPKAALALTLAALLAATLLPATYRIGAPARIEGATQRVVAAPFDGFLQRSHVRPGDTVSAGELLVEMADQDLTLEQRKWESTLTQQENAFAAALARADRAQFVISRGKADEARSQLELVRQQLARTRLLSPIDGVVIKGDLGQALGAPVQRGEALLTLAPREQYRLIVEVDERDIADVRRGQSGVLALASMPSHSLPLVVERVTPVSSVQGGRNVFEVEARLTDGNVALRPGLQGVARIEAGTQSWAWIWTHRIVDGLRLAWWRWAP